MNHTMSAVKAVKQAVANAMKIIANSSPLKGATPDFNNCGVLNRKPDGCLDFVSKNRKSRAAIKWAKIGNDYLAEYRYRFMCGRFQSTTLVITTSSRAFGTLEEAIIHAGQRLKEDATAKFNSVDKDEIPEVQKKAYAELIEWVERQIANPPKSPTPKKPLQGFTFLDLFAGAGGFHLGLSEHGAICVGAVEWDKAAQKSYLANHAIDKADMHGDITKINPQSLKDCDVVTGGFPCQPFSIAGKKQGVKDEQGRGTLFFDMLGVIKAKRPKIVLLENVPNLATIDEGKTCDRVLDEFTNLGYMTSMQMMVASEFGVPQQRKRLFFVGIRHDIYHRHGKPYVFPKGATPATFVKDILEPNITKAVNGEMVPVETPSTDTTSTMLVGHLDGQKWQGNRIFSIHGQGVTLCANSGGAAGKTGIYDVNGILRGLTPREAARMQGFPDEYKIVCSRTQALKQFGNSVAVPVVSAIAETFGEFLTGGP